MLPIAYSMTQVPSDDPGDKLAEGGVGVGVGRAGDRYHRGELGVAECGESAGDRRKDEEKRDCRPAIEGGVADSREDAGANDRSDSERSQIDYPERRPQASSVRFSVTISRLRIPLNLLNRFPSGRILRGRMGEDLREAEE